MSYILGRLTWIVLRPSNLLLILAIIALVQAWRGRRLGLIGLSAILSLMLAATVLPLGQWMLSPLEERFPPPATYPAHLDGIIVLGGGVQGDISRARGQPTFDDPGDRYLALIELARRYPGTRLIFTGGAGIGSDGYPESEIIRQLAARHGLAPDRITLENRSRNTFENAVYSHELAQPLAGQQWLLVTSASHMPRAMGVFQKLDWPMIAWPVDYRTVQPWQTSTWQQLSRGLLVLDDAAYEYLGLAYYLLLGHTSDLFPAPGATP